MTWEIILMFIVLFLTVLFFVFEIFPVDKIAFIIIVSLTLLGLVSPEEAISGFSNSATVAVLALMILAIAMEENGVIHWLTSSMGKIKSMPLYVMAPIFMFVTAGISAFISTTAVVIVFIKIINQLSQKYNISQSKLLLPISFAGILGGSCTLMGTSTNLIVNSVSINLGAEKLGFFDFSLLGLIFLGISVVYLTFALRWLPYGSTKTLKEDYDIQEFITTVSLGKDSKLVGETIENSFLFENPDISLLALTRNGRIHNSPGKYITLKANDQLLVSSNLENLHQINESDHLTINEENQFHLDSFIHEDKQKDATTPSDIDERIFVELLMLPGAAFLGRTLANLRTYINQGAIPIAIKKRKSLANLKHRFVGSSMNKLVLRAGDRLLLETTKDNLESLETIDNTVLLNAFEAMRHNSKFKRYFSLAVLLLVVALAATSVLSILVSALSGVVLLLITNNLDLTKVYKKINWQIFFLLAGMIPLGIAMHNTGADIWISEKLLGFLNGQPNFIIIGTLFLVTMLLSGVVSNNATAIIMTPIAISIAQGMDLDFKPFILSVMFAANFSFFTPVGYQTNTLIYALGNYNFKHFLWIGGLLSITLWITATLLLSTML